jgi:hypothetical protein
MNQTNQSRYNGTKLISNYPNTPENQSISSRLFKTRLTEPKSPVRSSVKLLTLLTYSFTKGDLNYERRMESSLYMYATVVATCPLRPLGYFFYSMNLFPSRSFFSIASLAAGQLGLV